MTVAATGRCADPWSPGDAVQLVIDPADRDRLVAVGDVIGVRQAQVLPVVVAGFGAVAAGHPLGLLLARRRDVSAGRY